MAEHEQASESSGGKLSTKKLIIIIVGGLLLLAAGGAGVFFVMKGQMTEHPQEESHKKHDNAASIYYEMSKPFVVDFPTGLSMALVQIATTFVVEDQETADALKKNEPMLRNNLMLLVSKQTPDNLNTSEGKEQLRKAMLEEVANILKTLKVHGEVNEVLFTSFIMQ